MVKNLIFDSGPLINYSMNGLLYLLESLKKNFKGDFLITKEVKEEVIDHPLTVKRFKLEALRLEKLFKKDVIKHADLNRKEVIELKGIRESITSIANNTFKTSSKNLHLIDKGEAAAFALSVIMKRKTGEDAPLAIDERTARMLCENPENLRKLLERKFQTSVTANKKNYLNFKDFKIIRSTELAYIAYKKGLLRLKDPEAFEAMLYGLKFKGTSVSEREIQVLKRL